MSANRRTFDDAARSQRTKMAKDKLRGKFKQMPPVQKPACKKPVAKKEKPDADPR